MMVYEWWEAKDSVQKHAREVTEQGNAPRAICSRGVIWSKLVGDPKPKLIDRCGYCRYVIIKQNGNDA